MEALSFNGFDEAFEGWGREDSALEARFGHAGVSRRHLGSPRRDPAQPGGAGARRRRRAQPIFR